MAVEAALALLQLQVPVNEVLAQLPADLLQRTPWMQPMLVAYSRFYAQDYAGAAPGDRGAPRGLTRGSGGQPPSSCWRGCCKDGPTARSSSCTWG